jgi:hypothetical protein
VPCTTGLDFGLDIDPAADQAQLAGEPARRDIFGYGIAQIESGSEYERNRIDLRERDYILYVFDHGLSSLERDLAARVRTLN